MVSKFCEKGKVLADNVGWSGLPPAFINCIPHYSPHPSLYIAIQLEHSAHLSKFSSIDHIVIHLEQTRPQKSRNEICHFFVSLFWKENIEAMTSQNASYKKMLVS